MEERKLAKIALLAEIIGGAAVVITLIFLVLETRDNTRALQAQTYMELVSELNVLRTRMSDPKLSRIFTMVSESDRPPEVPEDRYVYGQIVSAAFAIYESAYYAREKGVLDDSEWSRFEGVLCRNMRVAAPMWAPTDDNDIYPEGIQFGLTSDFVAFAEAQCNWGAIKAEMIQSQES